MSQGAESQADGGKGHQHSYSSLDSSGSSGLPSILKAFTPERLTPVNNLDVGSDQTIPFLLDHPSAESLGIYEPRLMSVLTQTELSWLLSHRPKNTEVDKTAQESKAKLSSQQLTHSENSDQETESILGDDISDTDSKGSLEAHIVHSEFVDDLKCGKLFGSSLHTLSSVGPPTILAYKQESKEKPINYEAMSPKDENILLQNLKELSEIREYWQWTSNRAIQTQLLLRNIEESSSPTNESAMSTGSGEEAPGHDAHLLQPIGVDNWKLFRDSVVSLGFDLCQFCGKSLKPLPTHKQLSTEPPETLFCCKEYQDSFEFQMREEEFMRSKAGLELISISPHLPYSSLQEREEAKEKAAMKLRDRELEKYFNISKDSQRRLSMSSRKLTTIAFQLSNSLDFVTLKKTLKTDDESDIFTELEDDMFSRHKVRDRCIDCRRSPLFQHYPAAKDLLPSFLVKYYRNGNKVLTILPDGTGQIFYPSGNLAILIFTDLKKRVTCIVQEDRAADPAIQAVFSSCGRSTCYHPNGVVWLHINVLGGHYSDQHGTRVMRWYWRDRLSPLVIVPFKPIFISLNENIGVRIISQHQIFITFLAMGKQAKFNVGMKLKFKQGLKKFLSSTWITEDDLLLQASRLKVQTIINKLCIVLNYPSNDPEKIPLPLYLASQQHRLSQLYANIKM